MNRNMVYAGAIPLATDILSPQQNAMIGLGALLQAAFGTSTVVNGLAGTQTTVPSMTINIGPGSIIALEEVDQNAYGSLGTNTAPLVKQGINLTATPFTLTAPATSGQSINYLIEAEFVEADGTPIVLPYVNPSSPSTPFAGPNNTGAAQNTVRTQTVGLQLKAGAAANTGTQTTPGTDVGFVPLYVITVNNGQTTVTTAQITVAPGAPFIDALGTGRGIQGGRLLNVQTFTTAGVFTYTPTPGTNSIEVEVQGAGGAAGGAPATTSTTTSVGGGGGAGAWALLPVAGPISPQTVTVGAGGVGVLGAPGGNGGASSFGSLVAANGGSGGNVNGPSSGSSFVALGGSGGVIGSTGLRNQAGLNGSGQLDAETSAARTSAAPGTMQGAGGGGGNAGNLASSPAAAGQNGQAGGVIIREFS